MSETAFRVTTPDACFGFVVDDRTLRVIDCAPIGRRALMGLSFGGAITYCHGRGWRTETVRPVRPSDRLRRREQIALSDRLKRARGAVAGAPA